MAHEELLQARGTDYRVEATRNLFEEHQDAGTVVLKYDTQVFFGPLSRV